MTNPELESKKMKLKESTLKSIAFSLMAKDKIARITGLPPEFKTGEGLIVIRTHYGALETSPSEPYEEDTHVPLYTKLMAGFLMASLRSGAYQASASVDLTEKEIDYLNRLYLGRMRKKQDIEPSVEELMRILDEEDKSRTNTPESRFKESREIFMELNSSWNSAGGIPRSAFLEFTG